MRNFTVADLLRYRKCKHAFYMGLQEGCSPMWESSRELLTEEAARNLRDLSAKHFFHYYAYTPEQSVVVDLLIQRPFGWEIVFDTSSMYIREAHIWEAAFMLAALSENGFAVNKVTALCINGNYVRGTRTDYRALYRPIDITRRAFNKYSSVFGILEEMQSLTEEPECHLQESCLKPRECPFWRMCTKDLPHSNIFTISGIPMRDKFSMFEEGITEYPDVLEHIDPDKAIAAQIRAEIEKSAPQVNAPAIKRFLKTLNYPMAFLDFESHQPPVPHFEGCKPFEQTPFLYSLHVWRSPDAEVEHYDVMVPPGEDPRPLLAEGLVTQIPDGACVIVYSCGLERQTIKMLADRFPEYREKLLRCNEMMRDLLPVFRNRDYYDYRMQGSCSLKKVYPAFAETNGDVEYYELDGVQNGEDAMLAYDMMAALSPEEQKACSDRLREYCALDTFAMVRIVQGLQAAIEGIEIEDEPEEQETKNTAGSSRSRRRRRRKKPGAKTAQEASAQSADQPAKKEKAEIAASEQPAAVKTAKKAKADKAASAKPADQPAKKAKAEKAASVEQPAAGKTAKKAKTDKAASAQSADQPAKKAKAEKAASVEQPAVVKTAKKAKADKAASAKPADQPAKKKKETGTKAAAPVAPAVSALDLRLSSHRFARRDPYLPGTPGRAQLRGVARERRKRLERTGRY